MRGIKRWFRKWKCELDGHWFIGKYDVEPPKYSEISFVGSRSSLDAHLDKLSKKTYICSVCRYCGKVIHKR